MKVTKWQLKSRKLCTSCVYPHRYRKLIKPSRRIICFWFITLRPTYKDTDTLEEHWAMRYFEKWQEEREQDIRNVFNMLYFYDFRSESVCKVKTVWAGDHVVWSRIISILLFYVFLHSWKMVHFRNLLYTLPIRFGYYFSRLTVRCLFEGRAQVSETSSLRITQLYVIFSSISLFVQKRPQKQRKNIISNKS